MALYTERVSENISYHGDEIPEGWERVKLPQVAGINMGQSPPGSTYNERGEGFPFFQGKADFGTRYPMVRVWCTEPKKIAKPGDVLISVRAPVGPTNVADRICAIGRGLAAITPFGGIPTEFILFKLRLLEPELSLSGTGSTFTAINRKDLEEIDIDVPPLEEQKRIVAKAEELLARVNATKERLAKVVVILKRFRQAVLSAACSGRLTEDCRDNQQAMEPSEIILREALNKGKARSESEGFAKRRPTDKILKDNRLKQEHRDRISPNIDELPKLPEGWFWATIDQLASTKPASIQSGPFGSNLHHSEFQKDGILAIGIDNILDGKFALGKEHRISQHKYQELKKYTARPQDVLITVMATIGRCCVLPEDIERAIITKHVYRITVDRMLVDPYYLMFALQGDTSVQRQIQQQIRGQTRPGINGQILKKIAIPTPSIMEQSEIVLRVEKLLKLADGIWKRVAYVTGRSEKLAQAVLAKAFRGELVPTEAELARREGRFYEPASALLARIKAERAEKGTNLKPAGRSAFKNRPKKVLTKSVN